jgi:uncharacterized SAM-binding protein YcdF (DUF218 family)
MAVIVKITGIAIILLGIIYIISPVTIKVWLKSWEKGKLPGIAVLVNFLIGALLIFSASECTISWIPFSIGALCVIKGLVLLIYGPKRLIMKASIWFEPRITLLRFSGFIPVALGIMLIMSV